jgi:protein-L-isoaspartate(D-aspartate) O-methyltransferase
MPARWLATSVAFVVLAAAMAVGAIMVSWLNLFRGSSQSAIPSEAAPPKPAQANDPFAAVRRRMVDEQLRRRDVVDSRVLDAMERVPRHRFVSKQLADRAYDDCPQPIGLGQTISQPYVVALITQAAKPKANDRVLEVGVGSGYQAAILAELCKEVYGVEIHCPLADSARERLAELGYRNIAIRCGDGYEGWSEHAPFDVIIVSAAPQRVPPPLLDQLAPGGRLVIPVGGGVQDLLLIEKRPDGTLVRENIAPVQFVPMTGKAEE